MDKVIFTTSKFVTNPIGSFLVGDDISELTIAQLFAKLLGLSDEVVDPDVPDIPDTPDTPNEPTTVVETIIKNKLPMFAITAEGNLTEIPFTLLTMTEDEAAAAPTVSGFYQIIDTDGSVIESGYQELQADSNVYYYVIAFPKAINYDTMIVTKCFNTMSNQWMTAENLKMVSDPYEVAALCEEAEISLSDSDIDQNDYTILVCEDLPSGSLIRYVITE